MNHFARNRFAINRLQALVNEVRLSYLLTDLRNRDVSAYSVLGIDPLNPSRRWYYLIAPNRPPLKIVHRVEPDVLAMLPGESIYYSSKAELQTRLKTALQRFGRVMMNYSSDIPVLSIVDAGTVDLVRHNTTVVPSAPILNQLLGTYPTRSFTLQAKASKVVDRARADAFAILESGGTNQRAFNSIIATFNRHGLVTEGAPVVAFDTDAANPHFDTVGARERKLTKNCTVLIDLWAKLDHPDGIFFDSTWCGYRGKPPREYLSVFNAVMAARDSAIELVMNHSLRERPIRGRDVDARARSILEKAGYGKFIVHRTGHSIGRNIHGQGANLDSFETNDTRELLPLSSFSIEPGLYIPTRFGVRLETTMAIDSRGRAAVIGELQREPVILE